MESNIKNEEINNDNFSTYICLKCSKQIDARNKILHETFCMEIMKNEESERMQQINNFSDNHNKNNFGKFDNKTDKNSNTTKQHQFIKNPNGLNQPQNVSDSNLNIKSTDVEYPSLDEINHHNFCSDKFKNNKQFFTSNSDNDINSLNKIHSTNFNYCKICDNYFDEKEIEDHLMCHKIDKEDNANEHEDEDEDERISNHVNNINEIEAHNPNEINISQNPIIQRRNISDEEAKEYDMVEDADSIRRQCEEDEVFKRKFAEKKQETANKEEKHPAKRVLDYLLDSRGRRVPPIVRLIGAFFDRKQLFALAAEEVAVRVADSLNPQAENRESDEKILFDLIPEVEIKDMTHFPEDKKDCIICMSSYEVGDKIMNLPCLHIYHSQCIKDWFKNNKSCPVCKHEIKKEDFQ